jgi:signal transduction histidine kinase
VGKPFTDVLQHEPFVRLLERSMHEEQELQEEISVSSAGDRIFQAQTSLMKTDEDRTNVVAILNDITEIRNVERMKTSFVSTVSHELRTPLTSIKGFISTLLQDTEGYYDNETRLEFYNIIDQECDRLHRLISDLLNISRIEAGRALEMNWKTVNIAAVARRVAAAQQSYTNKHRVVVSIPDDFPTIVADEDKVNQIIDNLVGNAIKYSPDGGEVEVSGTDEGDTIRVCVSDEGIGIPEAHREKVFERFHRVDTSDTREAQGTGIGCIWCGTSSKCTGARSGWSEAFWARAPSSASACPRSRPRRRQVEVSRCAGRGAGRGPLRLGGQQRSGRAAAPPITPR